MTKAGFLKTWTATFFKLDNAAYGSLRGHGGNRTNPTHFLRFLTKWRYFLIVSLSTTPAEGRNGREANIRTDTPAILSSSKRRSEAEIRYSTPLLQFF